MPFLTQSGESELESQYNRIKEQFSYLAALLKKYPVDKLVIVGDHPPPFLTESERSHYSSRFVPALIIERKPVKTISVKSAYSTQSEPSFVDGDLTFRRN